MELAEDDKNSSFLVDNEVCKPISSTFTGQTISYKILTLFVVHMGVRTNGTCPAKEFGICEILGSK